MERRGVSARAGTNETLQARTKIQKYKTRFILDVHRLCQKPAHWAKNFGHGRRQCTCPANNSRLHICSGCSGKPAGMWANQNRMTRQSTFAECAMQVREFIKRHAPNSFTKEQSPREVTNFEFNRLALELFRLQFDAVPVYRRLCETRRVVPEAVKHWEQVPALPVSAFKTFEVSSLPPEQRI